MAKVVFVVNNPSYFVTHRMSIGLKLMTNGYDVYVIAPGKCPDILTQTGFKYYQVEMSRKGMNLFSELLTIWSLVKVFRKIKPNLIHLVTIKPYLYGGIAARIAKVPSVVSAVAGLGILFSQHSAKTKLLRVILYPLYHFAFGHENQKVIFQNSHDRNVLVEWGVLDTHKTILIRGAGVDLKQYAFVDEPENTPVVSFASRLLLDKGVAEFSEASRILKSRNVVARFWLIGEPDLGNANSVTEAQLQQWEANGIVELLGFRKDIPTLFSQSNIITLPSFYGEGLPKVLVEAAACGRAVITTDHPGCRDAIEPDETGILVPIRDAVALANAIENLIKNTEYRKRLGQAGRLLAEREFTIEKIVDAHIRIYNHLLKNTESIK